MDPVTHLLTGACMGRSGFNRKSTLATLTMVLAAEAADLDVLWEFKGSIAALQHHRGITHSFVGVPLVAAAVVGGLYVWWRLTGKQQVVPASIDDSKAPVRLKLPVRWGYLYFLAVLAALSHLLLDYTTAYGIRLFAPFNWRWYSWDIVYIIEPVMLVVLIAGLTMPALFGLINQEIGVRSRGPRGRGGAIFALVCLVLLWGFRDYHHRRAVNALSAISYRGAQPTRLAAYPYMANPFHWHGVVETADFFETVPVDSLGPLVDAESQGLLYYKPEETQVTLAAKSSYLGQVYLDWAVFPFVQTQPAVTPSGTFYLVNFQDLRYTYPDMRGGRSPLSGYVVLAPNLQVQEEGLATSKSPTAESLEHSEGNR